MSQAIQKKELPGASQSAPVLKWAGGKTQLLPIIRENYPQALIKGQIDTYIEPFVGGGAVFFDVANNYAFNRAVLIDVNPDLVNLYNTLKYNVDKVIRQLKIHSEVFLNRNEEGRLEYYYAQRNLYNSSLGHSHTITAQSNRAALTIFLNRTCFNGLFRVNSKGHFNVPIGRYKNPLILDIDRLVLASEALKRAEIIQGDFSLAANYVRKKTFIYYDPPYFPISDTSHFNMYSAKLFGSESQELLAHSFKELSNKGVLQLLSNSDPEVYTGRKIEALYPNTTIIRLPVRRLISAKSINRTHVTEVLIRNYDDVN